MFPQRNPKEISFYGVGIVLIILGAGILSVGAVEWLFNYFGATGFVAPLFKVIGGAVVLGLGYIQIELELIRKAK